MTNPNNAIGTPSGYGGRTSVLGYNAIAQGYARGILSGFKSSIATGTTTITIGGSATEKDVAIAQNSYGEKAFILNTSNASISISLPSPTSTTKYASIVAYISSNAPISSAVLDNTNACGIIAVVGTGTSFPTESQIRTAIASDGGDSLLSPYVVVARATYSTSSSTAMNSNEWANFATYLAVGANTTIGQSTTTFTKIPLVYVNGDDCDTIGGEFVVPAGIDRISVEASFGLWVNTASAQQNFFFKIQRTRGGSTTNINELITALYPANAQNRQFIPMSALIDVQAGDLIGFYAQQYSGTSTASVRATSNFVIRKA